LAESTVWRPIPYVHVPRMPPSGAGTLCSMGERPDMVFQMPQVRWHYVSVHHGSPVGPLGASCPETACPARMGKERHYADQAARYAREDVPAYFGDAGLPRGGAEPRGELRSKIHTRSALCPSMAPMPK